MRRARQHSIARALAMAGAAVTFVCTAFLAVDYAVARYRAPRDERLITDLQKQVKTDSSLAPKLEAEHKRITGARLSRKARIDLLAILLMIAGSAFVIGAKWMLALRGPRPIALSTLVQLRAAPAGWKPAVKRSRAAAPGLDLSFVDETVAQYGRSREAAILILQAIQTHYRYLPDEALARVCELTEITPAQIAGASTFYAQFRRSPVGRQIVRVCHGTACHVSGARQITDELRRHLKIPDGADTDPTREFTIDEVACLGCCSLAPVLMVDGQTVGKLTPSAAREAIGAFEPEVTP